MIISITFPLNFIIIVNLINQLRNYLDFLEAKFVININYYIDHHSFEVSLFFIISNKVCILKNITQPPPNVRKKVYEFLPV